MSYTPHQIATRLVELYRTGGRAELARGIGDWIAHHRLGTVLANLLNTATLEVDGVAVTLVLTEREDLIRAQGHGERDALSAFVGALEPDDIVWDIGANVGTYSLLASQLGATVHAFEPSADARQRLERNADLNTLTPTVHPIALSDTDGTATLSYADRSGVRELTVDEAGDTVTTRRGDTIDAPTPDIIKIDVEGAELAVLDGLSDRLDSCRLCFVEVHDTGDLPTVRDRLEARGFTVSAPFNRLILKAKREV